MDKHDSIVFKPLLIAVPEEREAIYNKLKNYMSMLEEIINNPDADKKEKMKAVDSARGLANIMFDILKYTEGKFVSEELEKLKEEVHEELRRRGHRKHF